MTEFFSSPEWLSITLTLKLASITTLVLLIIALPLAWWLANTQHRLKPVIESIVALPLVLPPSVLGFYLLISLSHDGWLGQSLAILGIDSLVFSFSGLVVGSVIYSFPFVVQPMQHSFAAISKSQLEMAATLGASAWDRFFNIVVPLSKGGIITAAILGFAHTLGEFGVVLMLGGNIPGETQVLSILIYEHVETLEYGQAHWLSSGLLVFSFLVLFFVYRFNRPIVSWK